MTDQERQLFAPLADAMKRYRLSGALPFHTPGHKQGFGAPDELKELVTAAGLREDVSLMADSGLDDLHCPRGCIREAELLYADLYGAADALFMVNGTTSAIHTMLMATLKPGDEILLPRNVHRSVHGGLVLCGAKPAYITTTVHKRMGVALPLTAAAAIKAINAHPNAKAILLVHPTYYGVASDLQAIVEAAHARGLLVLVDEAHGAHLRFDARLPKDAISCGADLVAQSTHKLLAALTQASVLLVGDSALDRVDLERVRRAMSLLTTTSPSYLLMASLDLARHRAALLGQLGVEFAIRWAGLVRDCTMSSKNLWYLTHNDLPSTMRLDYTKLNAQVDGMTGVELCAALRRRHIEPELADPRNVLLLLTVADRKATVSPLIDALNDVAAEASRNAVAGKLPDAPQPRLPRVAMTPREAHFAPCEFVPLQAAVGRVSADEITVYPPGIPALCPGERITPSFVAYARQIAALGLAVTTAGDSTLRRLRVVK